MKKFFKYKLVILFTLILVALTAFDMVGEVKGFSQLENRNLEQKPKFSKESLMVNEFTLKYEKYIDDQFVFRDKWINAKSRMEYLLGKIENNGVVFGKQNFMFEKYPKVDEERLNANIGFIEKFIKSYDGNVTLGVVPSSYMKNSEKLPFGLNNLDQNAYLDNIYEDVSKMKNAVGKSTGVFDMKETPIEYYRTDHHWTTVGAHKAYAELMEQMKLPYIPLERGILGNETTGTLGLIDVGNFYGSYYNKTKAFHTLPDQLGYFDIPITEMTIDGVQEKSLYDYGKLATRDKYGLFLHGNKAVTVISSDNLATITKQIEAPIVIFNSTEGGVKLTSDTAILPDSGVAGNAIGENEGNQNVAEETPVKEKTRVLLIKDSYGNCFAPYLTYSFDEVVVVDLRSMSKKFSEFIKEKRYDQVIILYSFMNLSQDTNLAKISQ